VNDKDEVAIGAVPEDYPRRLPGFRPRSVGFHARSGGYAVLTRTLWILLLGIVTCMFTLAVLIVWLVLTPLSVLVTSSISVY